MRFVFVLRLFPDFKTRLLWGFFFVFYLYLAATSLKVNDSSCGYVFQCFYLIQSRQKRDLKQCNKLLNTKQQQQQLFTDVVPG